MNILITGGNGYIAKSLYERLKYKHNITTATRQNFNMADYESTCTWFLEKHFDAVIHTAIVGGSRLLDDDHLTADINVKMYENLLFNKNHFDKLISFGSGAEMYHGDTPYANSKREIAQSIQNTENFYNLRIFGVFDENELPTRFFKANMMRYIKREPMIIYTNKVMDFIYMQDLISTVEYYMTNTNLEKDINCCYEEKYTLKTIANMINSLDSHKVPIITENENQLEVYCGESGLPPINIIGLRQGIQNTFRALST
jgi:GDP-L-fucose synthase